MLNRVSVFVGWFVWCAWCGTTYIRILVDDGLIGAHDTPTLHPSRANVATNHLDESSNQLSLLFLDQKVGNILCKESIVQAIEERLVKCYECIEYDKYTLT